MAKYLLLIYGDEREWAAMSPQEQQKLGEAHRAFSAAAGSAIRDGQELEPAAVAQAHRRDWARVLAATAHLTRDFDLAEECTQDAYAQALQTWPETGIPDRPGAWLTGLIGEGVALLTDALRRRPPTRYAVEAAIAAVHAEAPAWQATDWSQIVSLYDVLLQLWPSPVVELNRAVAIGQRDGPRAGLDALTPLLADPALATYGYLSAARADFLRHLHHWTQAAEAYEEALTLTDNDVERAFLTERLGEVRAHIPI
jgi:predicted RNA polymerase sigma factor